MPKKIISENTSPTPNSWEEFCEQYNISLSAQQEAAVQAIEGPNLLLAVPGSGKTTVLIARLGYMITCKNIDPDKILAMTYTRAATKDMNKRFADKFGKELGEKLEFRTINGVADIIVKKYGHTIKLPNYALIPDEGRRQGIIRQIMMKYQRSYPTDNEVQNVALLISYIKNMMMAAGEILQMHTTVKNAFEIYLDYCNHLEATCQMDYDDQLIFALRILQNSPSVLAEMQKKYEYICVDEAQDTSKIQHEIIRTLAGERANLFMVGDEDQSIYGFRAAYPKALLDFESTYEERKPKVLLMETNYRSTEQIVSVAAGFISKNKDRHKKKIVANRDFGEDIEVIETKGRADQYQRVLEIMKENPPDTAILFRDNDSHIPIANLCLLHNVPFKCKNPQFHFFTSRVVTDILSFLEFAHDRRNEHAFLKIYYKSGYKFKKVIAEEAAVYARKHNMPIDEALIKIVPSNKLSYAKRFVYDINKLSRIKNSKEAIEFILNNLGYQEYIEDHNLVGNKLHTLIVLASQEPIVTNLVKRIYYLESELAKPRNRGRNCVTLSTVHSSKGLEYDHVYLVDLYDTCFPIMDATNSKVRKEFQEQYMEERRLFYVAITRAKNKLTIFGFKHLPSSFLREISSKIDAEKKKAQKQREKAVKASNEKVSHST